MASIRKRGSNSYLIVVSRGYDYEGNRLKSVQKTVKPPKEYTPKQAEKWVKEQAILFEREVQHTPEPINRSIKMIEKQVKAMAAGMAVLFLSVIGSILGERLLGMVIAFCRSCQYAL